MKRFIWLIAVLTLLSGCGGTPDQERQAMELRGQCLAAEQVRFCAAITADYGDTLENFTLECQADADGTIRFCVTEPEPIRGITGVVSGQEGALCFGEEMLAFPLMADERISPVSGPWLMLKALRSGVIAACAEEGDLLHITLNDSYGDDPLTVELWAEDGAVAAAEIGWRGRRMLSMQVEDFQMG